MYTDELRQRAVRLVREWQEACGFTEGGYAPISKQLVRPPSPVSPGGRGVDRSRNAGTQHGVSNGSSELVNGVARLRR